MTTTSDRQRRSTALHPPLQWCVTVLGLLMMTFSPVLWSADAHPARFIVKWKTNPERARTTQLTATRNEFRQATGLTLHARNRLSDRLEVMQAERSLTATEWTHALATLRAQPDVEYAVPDERRHITVLPSDPLITATSGRTGQWYLLNAEPASINAYDAWDYSQGGSAGSGVIVAVIDTGVRFDHPDLAGKLLPGYDFVSCDQASCTGSGLTYLTANDSDGWDSDASDPGDWVSNTDLQNHPDVFPGDKCETTNSSWHGTRIAGIIGAATNNGVGIAGTGWNTRILPVRALGKCGGYDSDILAGMRWAAGLPVSDDVPANPNPAKVINLSLGGEGNCSQAYADVITSLTAAGVSVVASAGNDSAIVNTPANCSNVIAVTAVRNTGTKVGFSSLGTAATIAAPGGNCGNLSGPCLFSLDTTTNLGTLDTSLLCPTDTNPNAKCYTTPGVNSYTDQYNANLGTSFSAPIVAGTVALMLGVNTTLTPAQITSTLRSTATAFPQTAASTCTVPTSSTPVTVNESECNCTTSTCGAGIINAYRAVLAASGNSSSSSTSNPVASAVTTPASTGGGGASTWNTLLLLAGLRLFADNRSLSGIKRT